MKYQGILLLILLLHVPSSIPQQFPANDSLLISEIMFYPVSGNNEFVELYNPGASPVDLNDYLIKYYSSTPDSISDAGFGTLLQPGAYAVIFEADYDFETGIYKEFIPSDALVLKIKSNAFGSNGMANTTSRPVWLISPSRDTLDCSYYMADNQQAHSDEKMILINDTSSVYWGNSIILNGTPGYRNSLLLAKNNLSIEYIKCIPGSPIAGEDIDLIIKIINKGFLTAENFLLYLYDDIDRDSIPEEAEVIFSELFVNLNSKDSIEIFHSKYNLVPGEYRFICVLKFKEDEDTTDNQCNLFFTVPARTEFGAVVINEIMYAPHIGEPEWIEIFNNSQNEINLKKWRIKDAAASVQIIPVDLFIGKGEYLVLAKDSSLAGNYPFNIKFIKVNLPSLNNTGDAVSLWDSLGTPVDSLHYLPDWGGVNNKSLERIKPGDISSNQFNWGASVNPFKSTPGFINSLTPKDNDIAILNFNAESDYGIAGEDIFLQVEVINKGILNTNGADVYLYRNPEKDSVIREENLLSIINTGSLLPGEKRRFSHLIQSLPEGENFFIANVNTVDEDPFNNNSYLGVKGIKVNISRNDVIINEIMYVPEDEPEWIELYNNSDKELDLNNFMLSDKNDTVSFPGNEIFLSPGDYVVLTNDSVSLESTRNIPGQIFRIPLPSLNNEGDRLLLMDSLGRIIDSLEYLNSMEGKNGYSIERIDSRGLTIDINNWSTSINKYRATPGYINSVSQKKKDIIVEDISFSPEYPVKGDTVVVLVTLLNKGTEITSATLDIWSTDSLKSAVFTLEPGVLVKLNTECKINGINEKVNVTATALVTDDQDTTNNYLSKSISPGYKTGTVVINEIMYNPSAGDPEWIELFNRSNDTLNLKQWHISDVVISSVNGFICNDYIFLPGEYLLLSSDTLLNIHYPPETGILIMKIPILNNDRDGVVLVDDRGCTIDSVFYTDRGTDHRSLERISTETSSIISQNWEMSIDEMMNTPGRLNSVSRRNYDLTVSNVRLTPEYPIVNDTVIIEAEIFNNGQIAAGEFSVMFYEGGKNLSFVLIPSIGPGESITVRSSQNFILTDTVTIKVVINYSEDEDIYNNEKEIDIVPGEKKGSLVINEIMYDPVLNEPEWVEIYNASAESMNLKNWYISDIVPAPLKGIITEKDIYIQPGRLFIIARDTLEKENFVTAVFGTLSSLEDGVILTDYRGLVIDSVKYKSDWGGGKGKSLERRNISGNSSDPFNWHSSINGLGATPGEQNSVTGIESREKFSVIINEIMYEPGSDNCEFIELYNRSGNNINLAGWELESNGENFLTVDTNYIIPPAGYFILAADSMIIGKYGIMEHIGIANKASLHLNNSEGMVILKDINGMVIDSVSYSSGYHNKYFTDTRDRSLEKINFDMAGIDKFNWTTSVSPAGATPGIRNSVITFGETVSSSLTISPNPFSPDNDGWEDFAVISYSFRLQAPNIVIKIFDASGRLVRTLAQGNPSGSSGSIIFDGRDDDGRPLRMGIYILYIEAAGIDGEETHKKAFVVARKL